MRSIKNCNVVVVGGAGFLGSHLVDHLINDRECHVTVVDNLVVGRREFVHKDATFVHHDITTGEDYLRRVFEKHQYVFNYAAYPYVPDSYARPKKVIDVNFTGAVNVINAAQEAGCEAILQVSSAELYGEGSAGSKNTDDSRNTDDGFQIDETGLVAPHSTYGVAKAAVDSYVQCAWKERQTPCIALRQFNCIGERETHPYVVPEIISQLMGQTKDFVWCPDDGEVSKKTHAAIGHLTAIVKLGNNSFRDFLYAGDAVRIAVELLERGQFGEVYNLGSETGVKIYDLAKLIGKVMGFADVTVERDEERVRPYEIWHLQSDNTKILKTTTHEAAKWLRNIVPLEDALKRTVQWYNDNGRSWPWEKHTKS